MKFRAMFQPIKIGPMTVKNRFVVPPMGNNFANTDGSMSCLLYTSGSVSAAGRIQKYVVVPQSRHKSRTGKNIAHNLVWQNGQLIHAITSVLNIKKKGLPQMENPFCGNPGNPTYFMR